MRDSALRHRPRRVLRPRARARYRFEAPDAGDLPVRTAIRFRDGLVGAGGASYENVLSIEGSARSAAMQDLEVVFRLRPETPFIRGDSNGDGAVDISDPVTVLGFLFMGGAPPACDDAEDANDDGSVDISDASYILNFLFLGGPAPPEPFGAPGADPTADGLRCLP